MGAHRRERYSPTHRRRRRGSGARAHPTGAVLSLIPVVAAVIVWAATPLGRDVTSPPKPVATEPSPTASPSPSPTPDIRDFTIVASGDLLIHSSVYEQAFALGHGHYDFRPMFARVRPIVREAALAICHVEGAIGAGAPSGYPRFNAPEELAVAIRWTGWDVCDTASNHSLDRGQEGIRSTVAALDTVGVESTGSFASAADSRRPLLLDVEGVRVAFLAYTYGTNGIPLPEPWSVNLISRSRIARDAHRARRRGAELVLVNLHWGQEYRHEPTAEQQTLARHLLRHRIVDLVVGQHAHVVQPIAEMARRFVVFGEGNLISAQWSGCCPPETQDGLVAVVHVHAVGETATVTGVDYIPTWVRHPGYLVLPVGRTLDRLIAHGQGDGALAQALRASFRRTVGYAGRGPHVRPLR